MLFSYLFMSVVDFNVFMFGNNYFTISKHRRSELKAVHLSLQSASTKPGDEEIFKIFSNFRAKTSCRTWNIEIIFFYSFSPPKLFYFVVHLKNNLKIKEIDSSKRGGSK